MGQADNLFASTEAYRLREALKEFGKIYGVKDANSFMQILLTFFVLTFLWVPK